MRTAFSISACITAVLAVLWFWKFFHGGYDPRDLLCGGAFAYIAFDCVRELVRLR